MNFCTVGVICVYCTVTGPNTFSVFFPSPLSLPLALPSVHQFFPDKFHKAQFGTKLHEHWFSLLFRSNMEITQ